MESQGFMFECSREGFEKAFKDKDRAIAVYTQPHCPHCKVAVDMLKHIADTAHVPLAEIDLGDEKCNQLADAHEIQSTPTILLVNRGVVVEKLSPAGLTPKKASEIIMEKLGNMPQTVEEAEEHES